MTTDPLIPQVSEEDATKELNRVRDNLLALEARVAAKEMSVSDHLRNIEIKEAEQRIEIRQFVLIICVSVIVFMGILAAHTSHRVMVEWVLTVPRSYAIAVVVAPIVSITTITVALLFGAFRRFKASDLDHLPTVVGEAAKIGSGNG